MPKETTPFFKRLLKSRLLIIIEIVVLVVFSSALAKEMVRKHQVEDEVEKLQQELAELEKNNIDLSNLMEYFNSDSFKEEQARLKLGLQKEGESVVTVLGDSTENEEKERKLALNNTNQQENLTNPQRWWNYFFKTKKEEI